MKLNLPFEVCIDVREKRKKKREKLINNNKKYLSNYYFLVCILSSHFTGFGFPYKYVHVIFGIHNEKKK
jgi:hypothetical protein